MNNADMPAMPGDLDPQEAAFLEEFNHKVGVAGLARWNSGLTKREYFAGLAMQGLASDSQFAGDIKEMAVCAVSWADALLEELEAAK